MDECADVLAVLVRPVQGGHDHLAQHLRQEVLGSLHVAHAAGRVAQALGVQVVRHDGLLGRAVWEVLINWAPKLASLMGGVHYACACVSIHSVFWILLI